MLIRTVSSGSCESWISQITGSMSVRSLSSGITETRWSGHGAVHQAAQADLFLSQPRVFKTRLAMSRMTASSSCKCFSSMSWVRTRLRQNELMVCRLTSATGSSTYATAAAAASSMGSFPRQVTVATRVRDIPAGEAGNDRQVDPAFPLGQCLFFERGEGPAGNPNPEVADLAQGCIPWLRLVVAQAGGEHIVKRLEGFDPARRCGFNGKPIEDQAGRRDRSHSGAACIFR